MKDDKPYDSVKMLQSVQASPNGKDVKVYSVGKTYDVPKHLYEAFIEMGVCEIKVEKKAVEVPENKAIEPEETKPKVVEENKKPKKRGRKKKSS